MTYTHAPVLLAETLEHLITDEGGLYLDATVGLGGHSEAILKSLSAQGRLIGTDMDPQALASAEKRLKPYSGKFRLVHANFRNLGQISTEPLTGALFDLGVSSMQLDKAERGFSIQHEGPLDMRMDPSGALTAERILNEWPAEQLELLLREYGEEREAGKIARWIVTARASQRFRTTADLKSLLETRLPRSGGIHPATRTFMALRIAVNQELENLTRGLEAASALLKPGGRIAVISFHSLEDRIVKNMFKALTDQGQCRLVTQTPVSPGLEEIERNPRARSAKLRVIERLK